MVFFLPPIYLLLTELPQKLTDSQLIFGTKTRFSYTCEHQKVFEYSLTSAVSPAKRLSAELGYCTFLKTKTFVVPIQACSHFGGGDGKDAHKKVQDHLLEKGQEEGKVFLLELFLANGESRRDSPLIG